MSIVRAAMPAFYGYTVNVSEGGMSITSATLLGPGDRVQLQFVLTGDEFQFELEATVCWANEQGAGMQFTSASLLGTAKLKEWLSRRLEETNPPSVRDRDSNLRQD